MYCLQTRRMTHQISQSRHPFTYKTIQTPNLVCSTLLANMIRGCTGFIRCESVELILNPTTRYSLLFVILKAKHCGRKLQICVSKHPWHFQDLLVSIYKCQLRFLCSNPPYLLMVALAAFLTNKISSSNIYQICFSLIHLCSRKKNLNRLTAKLPYLKGGAKPPAYTANFITSQE